MLSLPSLVIPLREEGALGLILEVSKCSPSKASKGLPSLCQYIFKGLLGSGAFNSLLFYHVVGGRHRWPHDVHQYISGQSFEEQLDGFVVPLGIPSFSGIFLEGGDILVDLREFHGNLFQFAPHSVFASGILELGGEFHQELVPHCRDVVLGWV